MYNTRKVADELYWVGANDHRTPLFENIHPIPRGVSYNAYLLLDEQTALLDTVDWSACRQLLDNLEHLLGGRELNWIVLHHMESDHAASLQAVLDRYPTARVAASAQAFRFLEQFGFQTGERERLVLKEGDSLALGRHTLTFYAAPMVHWPEVLVSLDSASGALFSADAFGTFGALDGKLFADEVDFDRDWLPDARRYYANIVGKYGAQVQALLKRRRGWTSDSSAPSTARCGGRIWAISWENTTCGAAGARRSRGYLSPTPPCTATPKPPPRPWPPGWWSRGSKPWRSGTCPPPMCPTSWTSPCA